MIEEEMTPEELCQAYLAEIARLYGKDRAAKSLCRYNHGWYYIKVAQRSSDGSVEATRSSPSVYRRVKVREMVESLRERGRMKCRRRCERYVRQYEFNTDSLPAAMEAAANFIKGMEDTKRWLATNIFASYKGGASPDTPPGWCVTVIGQETGRDAIEGNCISIDLVVGRPDGEITVEDLDSFVDSFVDWLVERGYECGGSLQLEDEGLIMGWKSTTVIEGKIDVWEVM